MTFVISSLLTALKVIVGKAKPRYRKLRGRRCTEGLMDDSYVNIPAESESGLHSETQRRQYCGLSTASEVFLIFTTQLYSCLCNYNAIVFISLQEGSIATGILPTPNTPLSSLPVGSKVVCPKL